MRIYTYEEYVQYINFNENKLRHHKSQQFIALGT